MSAAEIARRVSREFELDEEPLRAADVRAFLSAEGDEHNPWWYRYPEELRAPLVSRILQEAEREA